MNSCPKKTPATKPVCHQVDLSLHQVSQLPFFSRRLWWRPIGRGQRHSIKWLCEIDRLDAASCIRYIIGVDMKQLSIKMVITRYKSNMCIEWSQGNPIVYSTSTCVFKLLASLLIHWTNSREFREKAGQTNTCYLLYARDVRNINKPQTTVVHVQTRKQHAVIPVI